MTAEILEAEASPASAAEPRRLVDYAHRQLRNAILTNSLPADTAVSQVQLAKQLGLSRTPLREALRLLQHEGLATVQANKRVRIAQVTPEDLDSLYSLRIQQESLAIFTLTQRGSLADPALAERSIVAMERAAAEGEYEQWRRAHRAFHLSLVQGVDARLDRSILQHLDHAERYRKIYLDESATHWERGAAEHRSIVGAVTAGDGARAAELLAEHYAHTAGGVLAVIDSDFVPHLILAARTMAMSLRFATPITV